MIHSQWKRQNRSCVPPWPSGLRLQLGPRWMGRRQDHCQVGRLMQQQPVLQLVLRPLWKEPQHVVLSLLLLLLLLPLPPALPWLLLQVSARLMATGSQQPHEGLEQLQLVKLVDLPLALALSWLLQLLVVVVVVLLLLLQLRQLVVLLLLWVVHCDEVVVALQQVR